MISTMSSNYTLKNITELTSSGYTIELASDIIDNINKISLQMGLPTTITSNVYTKLPKTTISSSSNYDTMNRRNGSNRGIRPPEISDSNWESIKSFQATKIEHKTGIDAVINQLKLYLNKLCDKKFDLIRKDVIDYINEECADISDDDKSKIANVIYTLSSANKFYSKIFADLFSELATLFPWVKDEFVIQHSSVMSHYDTITYIDPDTDYDGFCEMNKTNERRRALSLFLVNLANIGFINGAEVIAILDTLSTRIIDTQSDASYKNMNDELVENVAILYNNVLLTSERKCSNELIDVLVSRVNTFATLKAKDFKGLSNKAIFKFMDISE